MCQPHPPDFCRVIDQFITYQSFEIDSTTILFLCMNFFPRLKPKLKEQNRTYVILSSAKIKHQSKRILSKVQIEEF